MNWKITSFEKHPSPRCWHAHIETDKVRAHVSQLEGETSWFIDGMMSASNGYPYFEHGVGGRGCAKRKLDYAEIVDTLNQLRDEFIETEKQIDVDEHKEVEQ